MASSGQNVVPSIQAERIIQARRNKRAIQQAVAGANRSRRNLNYARIIALVITVTMAFALLMVFLLAMNEPNNWLLLVSAGAATFVVLTDIPVLLRPTQVTAAISLVVSLISFGGNVFIVVARVVHYVNCSTAASTDACHTFQMYRILMAIAVTVMAASDLVRIVGNIIVIVQTSRAMRRMRVAQQMQDQGLIGQITPQSLGMGNTMPQQHMPMQQQQFVPHQMQVEEEYPDPLQNGHPVWVGDHELEEMDTTPLMPTTPLKQGFKGALMHKRR